MARRTKGRAIDGILLLNKPQGISSNKALQQAKGIYFAQKAGHTGALDPLATGMLPICFGEATKFTQFLLDTDKTYVVRAQLGERTTTSDSDGEIVETRPVNVTLEQLEQEIASFLGESDQYPSMYSALKYQGQPLYKYAREGIEVPRKCRKINVYRITLDEYDEQTQQIQMTVHVSKGTYIRTIVDDLGEKLGCGAHVIMLHRSEVGHYPSDKMITLVELEALLEKAKAEEIAPSTYLDELLLPMDTALVDLSVVDISAEQGVAFGHGQTVTVENLPDGIVKVVADGKFVGIGERNPQGLLKAKRALSSAQPESQ
ncbi:tRNA pseudouridine(55) synthase TruB [Pseudoalteromonas maricaloris]|uniref:tRNA pseudouridine synthase B n=1 Tax=Pseudoalteromonas maricaloris TaxID=184924 RepID=A0A8I2H3P2_9GAMM|nr:MULTISPECIES: tRNA pseudouridine(55) synthase TruB [Pseudoalteromonas]KID38638.1 pseudouridine synthase [Pseudoalteromonas flavipulchra NCIMB 2033 = ATCC BAA-314]MBD0783111.1 tRNA pseudouridine(55) synthase TruB [Pseudoalteromonas flavipulchra]MBE0372008.1 tRNA pseudouridine55 synthase [Pseudoalteromonas flavipulchra NCIMB 2033 = ATCC BAA-314]NLR23847.1 tRNA pseudouridine(55) synthase TruB [Pseudoalteromonas maricaloris]WOX29660.1 tRNA pseudouridine(55) synthase TruB [Pseudoalteromonas mari